MFGFLKAIFQNRALLLSLTKNDFKRQYLGSYFGIAWAFIQPLMMIIVLWFVFEIGFKATNVTNDIPFILWLITGMFPWFFFASSMSSGYQAVTSNAFLVKKILFRVSILPLVKISSAFIIHIVFLVFLMVIFMLYGYMPSIYWLQLPYYITCLYLLLLGLIWLTSSLNVFIKDVGNIVNILLQAGFWITPIFWSIKNVPEKFIYILQLNPMFYIVNGYRDTFINHIWFWDREQGTMIFIGEMLFFLIIGAKVFKKLRPSFGDVL